MVDWLRDRLKSGVILLGTVIAGKPFFAAAVTPDLVTQSFHAGNVVKSAAAVTGGGGGGRPEFATAGGRDAGKLEEAINEARRALKRS
jgi:alanyl-tRNA synthetase